MLVQSRLFGMGRVFIPSKCVPDVDSAFQPLVETEQSGII